MRKILLAAVLALAACGQAGQTAADGAAPAEAQAAGAAAASAETQAQYVARCTRETIATNPESQNWAQDACEQNWEKVAAAGPLAEAILAAAPASAGAVDLNAVRGRVTQVRWGQAEPGAVASGALSANLTASITRTPPAITFAWTHDGDIVPYDAVEALKGRGATLTQVACQSYGGPFDVVKVYNVTAPGRAPFGLSVYGKDAALAGAYAVYVVNVYLTGAPATLASVRAAAERGEEWSAQCPS